MNQEEYKPSKWLIRKLEDFLDLDEKDQQFVTKSIIAKRVERSKTLADERELVLGNELISDAVALHLARKKGIRGLSSGFRSLDYLTKGFVAGEVTIISARTSVGKTSLALAIAANITKSGTPVLFVTLEMTQAQLMERYISYTGGLDGETPKDEFIDIASLTFMQKSEKVSPDSIEGIIKNAKENGAGIVVLDHLHYFSRGSQTDDVERISIELSRTAKKYEIPIIAIAHTRKSIGIGKPKDSSIDDIRGASFISQDADIVLMLNRDGEAPNDLRVKLWKNRNAGIDYSQNEVTFVMEGSVIKEGWI